MIHEPDLQESIRIMPIRIKPNLGSIFHVKDRLLGHLDMVRRFMPACFNTTVKSCPKSLLASESACCRVQLGST